MPVISFDRAVEYYDETRGLAPGSADKIRDAILNYTQIAPTARFLELGIGTGRIALPFIEAGYEYDGVDISAAMMERLEQKIAALAAKAGKRHSDYRCKLIGSDITQPLPFEDGTYDVGIFVHVLHLIDDWRAVLREARRVLGATGSWLLIGGIEKGKDANVASALTVPANPNQLLRSRWNEFLQDLGVDVQRQTTIRYRDVEFPAFLQGLGASVQTLDLVEYEQPAMSPRMLAERLKAKMYSAEWSLPEDIHAEAVRRLEHWLATDCLNPEMAVTSKGTFRMIAAHW